MSLRLPQNLPSSLSAESNISAINGEIVGEKAAALGRSARQMERALKTLKSAGDSGGDSGSDRGEALRAASDAVYHFFIQRELCGFANHDEPIERYGIPNAVLLRLGAG